MPRKHKITVFLALFIMLSLALSPALAAENEDEEDDLEWRMELIEASRTMMEEEEEVDVFHHRLGTMVTNFPHDGARVNTGLRFMPHIIGAEERDASLRFMTELLYLRGHDDFAGFLSLALSVKDTAYVGVGAEIIGPADYQLFAGWEPMDNIFLEIKAINKEGVLADSKIYPALGFQMKF